MIHLRKRLNQLGYPKSKVIFQFDSLDTLNEEIRRKKSSFHPDDYFDDGKRQIDLILVWKKYPEGKNKDGSPVDLEKFQKRNAQREALFLEVSKNFESVRY